MESYYHDIMDKVLGRNHQHRSLRTIFDPYSHEWGETNMDQKVRILQKIVDSGKISLSSLLLQIKIYYTTELANKRYAIDSIDEAFAEILEYMLSKQTVKTEKPIVKSEKPVEITEKPIDKTEPVFEVGAEGGSICISRTTTNSKEVFTYNHSECDPTDEGMGVYFKTEFDNFEEPFEKIHSTYAWHYLYFMTVHNDYKKYIITKLIEKLNNESVELNNFDYHKQEIEKKFGIELIYSLDEKKMPVWGYKMH